MNRRNLALLLIAVLIFTMAACRAKQGEEPTETTQSTMVTEESVPGVEANVFNEEDLWEEMSPDTESVTESITEATEDDPQSETKEPDSGNQTEDDPQETTKVTEATKPTEATTPTQVTEPTVETQPSQGGTSLSGAAAEYARYNAMSPDEQVAYYNTFDSMEAFIAWYNNAKAEYDRQNPSIEIGSGNIDLGDIVGGNG